MVLRCAICVVLTVYHDLNVCYYGTCYFVTMELWKTQYNYISPNKNEVAIIFTDITDFDNEQKFTSAS